jgi:predicted metal-dependent HD superfamily phosphohydrolase
MNLDMSERWPALTGTWSINPSQALQAFEDIEGHYSERGRYYHTLDHIRDVLETVESLGAHAKNLNAVRLAAWLHDVTYNSRASDNEERSADYATRLCEQLGIPDGPLVASLILKTKTHMAGDDPDAQVLLDADLAVLGASPATYRVYAQNIRLEYAWICEPEYRSGRRRVLGSFLARPHIYHLLKHLEEVARFNLTAEIRQLTDWSA